MTIPKYKLILTSSNESFINTKTLSENLQNLIKTYKDFSLMNYVIASKPKKRKLNIKKKLKAVPDAALSEAVPDAVPDAALPEAVPEAVPATKPKKLKRQLRLKKKSKKPNDE